MFVRMETVARLLVVVAVLATFGFSIAAGAPAGGDNAGLP
jgi:hypothetical protein